MATVTSGSPGLGRVRRSDLPAADIRDWGSLVSMGDWSGALQAAADAGVPLVAPQSSMIITQPILVSNNFSIKGAGSRHTSITKVGTEVGTGSNLAPTRSGAVTDTYNKNAVIIVTHADDAYTYGVDIRGVRLISNSFDVDYGIYAPRTSQMFLEDVYLTRFLYGFVTNDSWMASMRRVIIDGESATALGGQTYGRASGSYGFRWLNDGSGLGTGTTLHMANCWARYIHNAYAFEGLGYSTLDSCASDGISGIPYKFVTCQATLNGCGMENVQLGTAGLYGNASRLTVNGMRSYSVTGASSGTTAMLWLELGQYVFNSCQFDNFAAAGTSYNAVIQNAAHVTMVNTPFPAGGASFIGYGTGSTLNQIGSVISQSTAAGTIKFVPLVGSATFDPDELVDGAGQTTTVTVTGAALGDFAEASFSLNLQGITVTAWVSATDTVSVRFQNETGGTVNLASGTLRVRVREV